ncbi:MAG: hypothetical protein KGJ55_09540 [Gammaproteobacteria bacterium]|nr:hypothetical protein [Gammaproteobacteria bacterium]
MTPEKGLETTIGLVHVGGLQLPSVLKAVQVEIWTRLTPQRGYLELLRRHAASRSPNARPRAWGTATDDC